VTIAKDLEKMSLEELVGILIVHKQVLHRDEKKSEGLNIAIKTR